MKQFFLVALASAFLGQSARAAEGGQNWVGLNFGFAKPTLTGADPRLSFGIDGGTNMLLDGYLGVGAFINMNRRHERLNTTTQVDFNQLFYGVLANFNGKDFLPGLYAGLRLGMSRIKIGSNTVSPLIWGLGAGYDYSFGQFSVGPAVDFLFIGEKSKNKVKVNESYNNFNAAIVGKFWF